MPYAPQPWNERLDSLTDLTAPASTSLLAMNASGAVEVTSVQNKKDLLWNLDTIPNFDTDGLPDPLDADAVRLSGLYFDESRSHFRAGRVNHRNCFSASDAQYSLVGGWACQATDATEASDGSGGKGATSSGYQTIVSGGYGTGFGFNNLLANGGFVSGFLNWVGGQRRQITAHTFTNDQSASTVRVAGNRTAEFPAGKLVVVRSWADAVSPGLGLNRVVSSSFASSETTIVLAAPLDFQMADGSTPDIHGDMQRSWISVLGNGAVGFAFGANNWALGGYSTCLGISNQAHNTYSFCVGKDTSSRSKGEIAMGGGSMLDGTAKRYTQKSNWHLKTITTNNTPKILTLDGNAESTFVNTIHTQNESSMNVSVRVCGVDQWGQRQYSKNWQDVAILHKQNGDTSIEFVSTPVEMIGANAITGAAATLGVAADGKIEVTVTGHASTPVLWTAWVEGIIHGWTIPSAINS